MNVVDAICDAFEQRLIAGERPHIEDFLGQYNSAGRSDLFIELLRLDVEYDDRPADPMLWEAYRRRFPQYADEIEAVQFKYGDDLPATEVDGHQNQFRIAVGTRIGRFVLVEKLGSGSAGVVWKARDARLKRFVALKVAHTFHLSEDELHRFLREGRAAAQLRHPAIVPVHEVDRDGETLFIVADWIDGENLRTLLTKRHFTPREAATLCCELGKALDYAHGQGIVHRDLKPANIIIGKGQEGHIADFGLAKWMQDACEVTHNGEMLGTPAYMSPEQARGEIECVDGRSDIYALGVLLYEVLTGRRPFQGDRSSVIYAIVHREPPAPRGLDRSIPHDLETICLKAIQKEPNDRYSTAGEMAKDLGRYLDDLPVVASRSSLVRRGWRWVRRRPAVAAVAIMAFVTLFSLSAAAMFAEKANSVIGLRSVRITTEPPGANVTCVPLDEVSGEPVAGQSVLASGRTPVDTDLRPGDYLVVAILADGRFHEVYRHVPRPDESLPGIHRHNRWTIRGNTVELPTIVIPELSATDGMAYIKGSSFVTEAGSIAANNGPRSRKVSSFFIDAKEFTVSEFVGGGGDDKLNDSRLRGRMMNAAANVSFDEATAFAELAGKRLPTEAEFEFAATSGGRYRFPWGDASIDNVADNEVAEFGPVGSPNFDVLNADRLVFGLCSNVAEWTSSKPHPSSTNLAGVRLDSKLATDYRVVKGGDRRVVEGMPVVSTEHRNPRDSVGVSRYYVKPGLGFRCVRSAKPRIGPDGL